MLKTLFGVRDNADCLPPIVTRSRQRTLVTARRRGSGGTTATLSDNLHNGLMTFIEEENHPQLTRLLIGRLICRMKQANKNDVLIRRAGCLWGDEMGHRDSSKQY
ncbi:hypothetical protein E2C01_029547 [Portunus trituberculatus]|uniref:Uncharacterized protein n=1 Tax=Portunus trituberculatus TaxID=210409 RepID=A0A5B7EN81_PORTR|nr:hypothetical protein [Portunus trituberculatus]